jgi:hypothetical protein
MEGYWVAEAAYQKAREFETAFRTMQAQTEKEASGR